MKIENALSNLDSISNRLNNLINEENFLTGAKGSSQEELIHSISEAIRYSTDQDIQDTHPEIQYWTSILEYNNSLLDIEDLAINETDKKIINEKIADVSQDLTKEVDKKISKLKLPDDISYVISENFNVFINEFSYFGKLSDFQEKLINIFERGFFPCGWRGKFPKGRIIIFSKR